MNPFNERSIVTMFRKGKLGGRDLLVLIGHDGSFLGKVRVEDVLRHFASCEAVGLTPDDVGLLCQKLWEVTR